VKSFDSTPEVEVAFGFSDYDDDDDDDDGKNHFVLAPTLPKRRGTSWTP
jgi:hypothetical protein